MLKNKLFLSFLSFMLAMVMLMMSLPVSATTTEDVSTETSKVSKIDSELLEVMEKASSVETIKVVVWLEDVDDEEFEEKYQSNLVKVTRDITSNSSLVLSALDNSTEKRVRDDTYSQMHTEKNLQWQKELEKLDVYANVVYSSRYSPSLILESTKSGIQEIAEYSDVAGIYLYYSDEITQLQEASYLYGLTQESQIETTAEAGYYGVWQNATNIYTMREVFGYDGSGVNIGLVEYGLPDVNHSSGVFENSNIIITNEGIVNDHATYTASILVGQTDDYRGVVPNASLYCASCSVQSKIEATEAVLDYGVDVLSLSLYYDENIINTYSYYDKYLDYLVYRYKVIACIASGNTSQVAGVASGAMSYNAITVGNINDNNTLTTDDDYLHGTSCFTQSNTLAYKPDVCAPGARVSTPSAPTKYYDNDQSGGTSAAAPVVAGICAQLLQAFPTLTDKPMLMKAILMCSANRIPNMGQIYSTSTSTEPAISRSYGAGLVNVTSAYALMNNGTYRYILNSSSSQSENPYIMDITVTEGMISASKKIAVTLTWTKKATLNEQNEPVEAFAYNHDLGVYDPNGNLVAYSNYQYDHKQFVYFEPTVPGVYQVKVYKTGESDAGVLTAISYNIK